MSKQRRLSWSPRFMTLAVATFLIGIMLGLAVFTFTYAKGASYLSGDPEACINCHIMNDEYNGWQAGVHANVATCSDCHLPQENIVAKYAVEAENGFMHGLKFTTGWHPENIVIRDFSLTIANNNCLRCHSDLTDDVRHPGSYSDGDDFSCVRCHSGVGHE